MKVFFLTRGPVSPVTYWTILLCFPLVTHADESRFSVLGWVKTKLSPGEEARSAGRSSRPGALPANQPETSVQTVAMAQPAMSSMQAPVLDPLAAPTPSLNPDPLPPSRPVSRDLAVGNSPPPPRPVPPSQPEFTGQRTVDELRRRAEFLATRGLPYKFGGDHPSEGGMDCSGTMQFLLKSMGYPDIPRTSYDQFEWLGDQGTLKKVGFWHSHERAVASLRPGDLVFWGGTYDSGHKVSHVMVYLGKSPAGTLYLFGARGKKVKGLNGAGVDIFEYKPNKDRERLVGYGRLPGIKG